MEFKYCKLYATCGKHNDNDDMSCRADAMSCGWYVSGRMLRDVSYGWNNYDNHLPCRADAMSCGWYVSGRMLRDMSYGWNGYNQHSDTNGYDAVPKQRGTNMSRSKWADGVCHARRSLSGYEQLATKYRSMEYSTAGRYDAWRG